MRVSKLASQCRVTVVTAALTFGMVAVGDGDGEGYAGGW